MMPCFGFHSWSAWDTPFHSGDGRILQLRLCLHCRKTELRTVADLRTARGVADAAKTGDKTRNDAVGDDRATHNRS